ncbi:MAG TPA: hypothetical protein VMW65_04340 [Chloroflexota bacterium]|nr:hypothetical protein [Chloroflexota bacterium]
MVDQNATLLLYGPGSTSPGGTIVGSATSTKTPGIKSSPFTSSTSGIYVLVVHN